MIDEAKQDLAIEYLLGTLDTEAARSFEDEIRLNPELSRLVDELRESAAALAHSVPAHQPPPHLRAKVLAAVQGEAAPARRQASWFPWTAAAALAIATGLLGFKGQHLQRQLDDLRGQMAKLRAEADSSREEAKDASAAALARDEDAVALQKQNTGLERELADLKKRDALAQVRIATLTAQVETLAKAAVTVVWDPDKQRGVIQLNNLPPAEEGKDYQLWVIDPGSPNPVDGGVLPLSPSGQSRLPFKPGHAIKAADKFAISLERAGGVPKAEGPIVFAGN